MSALKTPADLQPVLAEKLERKLRKGVKRFDKPKESLLFFLSQRMPAGEKALDYSRYDTALAEAKLLDLYATKIDLVVPSKKRTLFRNSRQGVLSQWTYYGPGNIGGRTRSLLINPNDPNIMYTGGVAGGVFKTINAGASWVPMTDLALSNLAVNAMAMDPNNVNTIYAGTGEGFFSVDAMRGAGIFKTIDGGATWKHLDSTNNSDFYFVNKIVPSPNVANRLYAATRTGVFVSTDAGVKWIKRLDATAKNGCLDLVVRTDKNPDVIFASCGTGSDANDNPIQAVIYKSSGAGESDTWNEVYTVADMGRTSLAIAPSDQDVIYGLSASIKAGTFKDGLLAVIKSTTSGDSGTWAAVVTNESPTKLNRVLLSNPSFAFRNQCESKPDEYFNQGWYDNIIAVDPMNKDIVWAGGIDLFRSDNGGASWGLASYWWATTSHASYNHADHHVIVFHPQYNGVSNKTMFVGNDGGVYKTVDSRAAVSTNPCSPLTTSLTWANLNNGLGITQFYAGAVYPNGDAYFGGTQDNGTVRGSDMFGANQWGTILGGDGGSVAVNPNDTNVLYAENTDLSLQKSTDGGKNFSDAVTGVTESKDNFLFIAPFVMDPAKPDRLWLGGKLLWRTNDAAVSWSQASAAIPASNQISAISVSPVDSNYVAAGTNAGYVLTTDVGGTANAATTWNATQVVEGGYISSVVHDPRSTSTLYATCSTFGKGHVWKSTDNGTNWATLDGTGSAALPDIPAHTILIDPNNSSRLYIGTDIGVFVSLNSGASWSVENTGFANAISQKLVYNRYTNQVFVFTHGRGVWSVPLANPIVVPAIGTLLLNQ
ncbi:WD40/YVTN/BNR-like repeat-containing protein [Solidesulfovibrio sp.]